jgi:type II secretory pathway pseudopilin PulG
MKRSSFAFTLVELLVAMAITSLLILLLGGVVSGALNVWQQGRNRLDTFANARFILGRIGDEISGAAAQQGRVQFVENNSIYTPAPVSGTSENIFFVVPYPNDAAGDLCVIAYRHDPTSFHLDRAFKDSQAGWAPNAALRYRAAGYSFAATDWRTIANGVLEFEIQSYSQADCDTTPRPAPTPSWDSETAGRAPKHVILRLKIVDDKTAVTLGALVPGPAYDRLVREKAREFTADITLPTH